MESNTIGGATVLVAELRRLTLVLLSRRLDVKNIMMSSASRSESKGGTNRSTAEDPRFPSLSLPSSLSHALEAEEILTQTPSFPSLH